MNITKTAHLNSCHELFHNLTASASVYLPTSLAFLVAGSVSKLISSGDKIMD